MYSGGFVEVQAANKNDLTLMNYLKLLKLHEL